MLGNPFPAPTSWFYIKISRNIYKEIVAMTGSGAWANGVSLVRSRVRAMNGREACAARCGQWNVVLLMVLLAQGWCLRLFAGCDKLCSCTESGCMRNARSHSISAQLAVVAFALWQAASMCFRVKIMLRSNLGHVPAEARQYHSRPHHPVPSVTKVQRP